MRAVVVYESMYGNTHHVAEAIGTGLSEGYDVAVVPVSEADPAVLNGADLVVVGGPTHLHGMSRPSSRKGAATAAAFRAVRCGPGHHTIDFTYRQRGLEAGFVVSLASLLGLGILYWFDPKAGRHETEQQETTPK